MAVVFGPLGKIGQIELKMNRSDLFFAGGWSFWHFMASPKLMLYCYGMRATWYSLLKCLSLMDARESPNTRKSEINKHHHYQILRSSRKHHHLLFRSVNVRIWHHYGGTLPARLGRHHG
uniref:Uncharacterized protein n=1 Tax=Arundo donax TaxID=35708 RepID=A0A0A9H556_ARUDO